MAKFGKGNRNIVGAWVTMLQSDNKLRWVFNLQHWEEKKQKRKTTATHNYRKNSVTRSRLAWTC